MLVYLVIRCNSSKEVRQSPTDSYPFCQSCIHHLPHSMIGISLHVHVVVKCFTKVELERKHVRARKYIREEASCALCTKLWECLAWKVKYRYVSHICISINRPDMPLCFLHTRLSHCQASNLVNCCWSGGHGSVRALDEAGSLRHRPGLGLSHPLQLLSHLLLRADAQVSQLQNRPVR